MKIPVILFDFDGVLADSFDVWFAVVKAAFEAVGRTLTPEQYRAFYLKNVKAAEQEFLGSPEHFRLVQQFIGTHVPLAYEAVQLFPFASTLVRGACGRARLAVVSSSAESVVRAKLAAENLQHFFQGVFSSSSATSKQEALREALTQVGCQPAEAFFVSDTLGDIQEGNALGLPTVGVSWGFHPREVLERAAFSAVVDTPRQLLHVLGA